VKQFLSKYAECVIGTLSGFDRLVFRGTLRMLAHRRRIASYLNAVRVLFKDFAVHPEAMTHRLRQASEALARGTGRPIATWNRALSTRRQRRARLPAPMASSRG